MLEINSGLIWTIVNLIVFYLLLRHFLFQPIQNIMKQREEMIQGKINHANAVEKEAEQHKQKYEQALADARHESMQIIAKAKQDAREEADAILSEANQEVIRMRKDAEASIEQERKRETKKMQDQVAGLALTAVQKVLSEQLNEKENENLYNRFLRETGEQSDTNRA